MGAGTCTVPLRHLFLDRHGTGYGIDGAGELDQHTVAGRLDDASLMGSDCRINHLAAVSLQCVKRSYLIRAHESAIASNVRRQHRRQSPFYPVARQWCPQVALPGYQSMTGCLRARANVRSGS